MQCAKTIDLLLFSCRLSTVDMMQNDLPNKSDRDPVAPIERRQLLRWAVLLGLAPAACKLAPAIDIDPMLRDIADLVIPPTATPGGAAVGAHMFVKLAAQSGMKGASLAQVRDLCDALNEGGKWAGSSPAQKAARLQQIDTAAFAQSNDQSNEPGASEWRSIKPLFVIGYYTSEVGASQELQFELVPGRFDPDLPNLPGDRAFSNDMYGSWVS